MPRSLLDAVGAGGAMIVPGALLALGSGWAFTGLVNLEVVRSHRHAPAAATGVTQAGLYVGGMLGPLAFGAIAERVGFSAAWTAAAASLGVAAVMTFVGRKVLAHGLRARPELVSSGRG